MKNLALKLQTAWSLGLVNISRVIVYRLGLRSGLNPVRRLAVHSVQGPFFTPVKTPKPLGIPGDRWVDQAEYFSWFRVDLNGLPPDWTLNPFTDKKFKEMKIPWWKIKDFDPEFGDIKTIWEPSRWDWVVIYAIRGAAGDSTFIDRLNTWLNDWIETNPPYKGPNWKCGQESSIRVLHLTLAAQLLGQISNPLKALVDLVRIHLKRIAPTIQYAIGQANNHGTSEAAALFIGGSWLRLLEEDEEAFRWEELGRRWLEDRVARLVLPDGTFSQYSVNYHRVLLDTLSLVELWRSKIDAPAFSQKFMNRAATAVKWLHAFVNPVSGDAPNLGANDGARFVSLDSSDYRDFRPAVQLAAVLFLKEAAYPDGPWNDALNSFKISIPSERTSWSEIVTFNQGGYACMHHGAASLYICYPQYCFRPSHSDAFHVDFWLDQENLLRDGGSYTYSAPHPDQGYFPGTVSHNTVQFDDRDQMPRLSRFLYGSWLKAKKVQIPERVGDKIVFSAAYRDWLGAEHLRRIELFSDHLLVLDSVQGFSRKAVLRWRLIQSQWQKYGHTWKNERYSIKIKADVPLDRAEIVEGCESRYYHQKEPLPVIEIEISKPGKILTEVRW